MNFVVVIKNDCAPDCTVTGIDRLSVIAETNTETVLILGNKGCCMHIVLFKEILAII